MRPITRHATLCLVAALLASGLPTSAVADAPPAPLRYRFAAGEQLAYDLTITSDLPDNTETSSGHLVLTVKSVDPATGQVTLSSNQHVRKAYARPPNHVMSPLFGGIPQGDAGEMTIDSQGAIVANRGGTQLPYLLGLLSQLAIEPLPANPGQSDWHTERPIEVQQFASRRMGRPRMFGGPPEHDDHSAQETSSYHVAGTAADGALTVHKAYALATDDKVKASPGCSRRGTGNSCSTPPPVGSGRWTRSRRSPCGIRTRAWTCPRRCRSTC